LPTLSRHSGQRRMILMQSRLRGATASYRFSILRNEVGGKRYMDVPCTAK